MKRKATTGTTKITSFFGLSSGELFAAPEETENDCPPAKTSKHRLAFDVSGRRSFLGYGMCAIQVMRQTAGLSPAYKGTALRHDLASTWYRPAMLCCMTRQ